MVVEPRSNRGDFPIRQERHDAPTLKVADDRAIAMVPPPGPVIDADHLESLGWQRGAAPHHPQQRIVADRQHQPSGKACRWPAAKCKPEMVDDQLKSRRSPRSLRHDAML